jgi:hypothetical protein
MPSETEEKLDEQVDGEEEEKEEEEEEEVQYTPMLSHALTKTQNTTFNSRIRKALSVY